MTSHLRTRLLKGREPDLHYAMFRFMWINIVCKLLCFSSVRGVVTSKLMCSKNAFRNFDAATRTVATKIAPLKFSLGVITWLRSPDSPLPFLETNWVKYFTLGQIFVKLICWWIKGGWLRTWYHHHIYTNKDSLNNSTIILLFLNKHYSVPSKPMHNIGKVSVNVSILYKNQEICNKTNLWKFQLISLFLLRENSKNAFSIFVFILMAGSYFTNYSKTITHQAEIFQGKLSTIVIAIQCKLCVNLWTFLFIGLTNDVQGL